MESTRREPFLIHAPACQVRWCPVCHGQLRGSAGRCQQSVLEAVLCCFLKAFAFSLPTSFAAASMGQSLVKPGMRLGCVMRYWTAYPASLPLDCRYCALRLLGLLQIMQGYQESLLHLLSNFLQSTEDEQGIPLHMLPWLVRSSDVAEKHFWAVHPA